MEERLSLPMHGCYTVTRDGKIHREVAVFCPVHRSSVAVETCRSCSHLDRLLPGRVECTVDAALLEPMVGALVRPRSICVADDVPVSRLTRLFARRMLAFPVIDEGRSLVGWVTESVLRGPNVARNATVGQVSRSARGVPEHASLRSALLHMVHSHARELGVVDEGGRLQGIVRDIDLLRWVSRAGFASSRKNCSRPNEPTPHRRGT